MPIKAVHRIRLLAGACLAALLFSGCMAKQTAVLMQDKPAEISTSASVAGVPFFPQQDYQCGPAAMAMALGYAGVDISPEQLRPVLFVPDKQGSLQIEMMALPRRYGMVAYQLAPYLDNILREIKAGYPVIVFQNLGLSIAPKWHYAVVTGFDLASKSITLHSGDTPDYAMPISTFERTWVRAGSWAMLVLPAGELPVTANEKDYLTAVTLLEKTGAPRAALVSYEAAITRWPNSLAALMGRGNSQYALGNLNEARQAYLQASHDHADSAYAFNNLAQTYLNQQDFELALEAIQHAILIDSTSSLYHRTWSEIEQRKEIARQQNGKSLTTVSRQ